MYFTYILLSDRDGKMYVGYTSNIVRRVEEHNMGEGISTAYRGPMRFIYYEACISKEDAMKREGYLKTGYGRRFIQGRLENYFRDKNS